MCRPPITGDSKNFASGLSVPQVRIGILVIPDYSSHQHVSKDVSRNLNITGMQSGRYLSQVQVAADCCIQHCQHKHTTVVGIQLGRLIHRSDVAKQVATIVRVSSCIGVLPGTMSNVPVDEVREQRGKGLFLDPSVDQIRLAGYHRPHHRVVDVRPIFYQIQPGQDPVVSCVEYRGNNLVCIYIGPLRLSRGSLVVCDLD